MINYTKKIAITITAILLFSCSSSANNKMYRKIDSLETINNKNEQIIDSFLKENNLLISTKNKYKNLLTQDIQTPEKFAKKIFNIVKKQDTEKILQLCINRDNYCEYVKIKRPELKNGAIEYFYNSYPDKIKRYGYNLNNNVNNAEIEWKNAEIDKITYWYYSKKGRCEYPKSSDYLIEVNKLEQLSFYTFVHFYNNDRNYVLRYSSLYYKNQMFLDI